jgi:riboflavin biosynthesis pyrimidine reductase
MSIEIALSFTRESAGHLGAKGVTRLLVEGGGDVLGQLHDLQLIDELWCFITPLLTGGNKPSFGGVGVESMEDASRLHRIRYKRIGNDVLVTGHLLGSSRQKSRECRSDEPIAG